MKRKSFTLIELVVVVAIIAILSAVIAPNAFKAIEKAKIASTARTLKIVKKAAIICYADTGSWGKEGEMIVWDGPRGGTKWKDSHFFTDSGLAGWDGPYLDKAPKKNPWGMYYNYFRIYDADLFYDDTYERLVNTDILDISIQAKIDSVLDDGDLTTGSLRSSGTYETTEGEQVASVKIFYLIAHDG